MGAALVAAAIFVGSAAGKSTRPIPRETWRPGLYRDALRLVICAFLLIVKRVCSAGSLHVNPIEFQETL